MKFFMQQAGLPASNTPYGDNESVGHRVLAKDAQIYYEVYGQGEPVLVLHGGGVGCSYEMGVIIDRLVENYQVIVISTRGHGKSEIGTEPLTLEQKADDVMSVIRAVTTQPVTVIGFSDGGYAGYSLAAKYPEAVKRLIAMGAGELVPGLRRIVPFTTTDIQGMDAEFMAQQMALMPEPERLDAYWKEYYEFYNTVVVSKELLRRITCPVLVMGGERDGNAPLDSVLAAYRMILNSRLAIIPNAPHPAFLTHFNIVWAAIDAFLQETA
jgi:pimeloyl-ACP methyl ester carboxylesterase